MTKYIMLVEYTHTPGTVQVLTIPGKSHLEALSPEIFHEMGLSLLQSFTIKSYQVAELQGDPFTFQDIKNEY